MKLIRITNLQKALELVNSRVFVPQFDNPLNADSGLNAFIKSEIDSFQTLQHFSGTGVTIEFEWTGETHPTPMDAPTPLPHGVLLDQRPWRVHIRGPIENNLLRVTNIKLPKKEELDCIINYQHAWILRVPVIGKSIRRHKRYKFLLELRKKYRSRECFIQIS